MKSKIGGKDRKNSILVAMQNLFRRETEQIEREVENVSRFSPMLTYFHPAYLTAFHIN